MDEEKVESEQLNDTPTENEDESEVSSNTEQSTEQVSKKQTRDENSAWAKMRRENEELSKQVKELQSQVSTIKERANSQISDETLEALKLTREDLDDPVNLKLVSKYLKAVQSKDENPIAYAYQETINERNEEDRKKREAVQFQEEQKKKILEIQQDEITQASKKFGKKEVEECLSPDSDFSKTFGAIPVGGLVAVLDGYFKMKKPIEDKAKDLGTIPTSNVGKSKDTTSDISKMSKEEFIDYCNKNGLSYLLP